MITLQNKHFINEGFFQKCYVHPDNDKLCLKIVKDSNPNDPRVIREIKYYHKIQRRNKSMPYLAKYHGQIKTNLGEAYVFDLIRDETTNNVSLTMYDYLFMENSSITDNQFLNELERLKKIMIKQKVIVRDLTGKNVCCRILKNNSFELIIIDGIGHRDFIPFVDWFRAFAKRKINKIYEVKKLHSMVEHRQGLAERFSQ